MLATGIHWVRGGLLALLLVASGGDRLLAQPETFRVMAWNIWHGGREDGEVEGPARVAEIIRDSGADLVALQETYGSGEWIAGQLGFHFHPRGTNVSLLSRYPVIEDVSVFEPFKCVGAVVELPGGRRVACYSIWLPYDREIWEAGTRDGATPESLLAACAASERDLERIREGIGERLSGTPHADLPIVIAGDFNSMSHFDYVPSATQQYQAVIDWPTSRVMTEAGFRDAWRETHPEVDRVADRTWSPRFPEQEQDRIDFVYYRGPGIQARAAVRIDRHEAGFPSDHAAVVAEFVVTPEPPGQPLRVVSYNIRHGLGTDNQLDLERTASVLAGLQADVIALQEVDRGVRRSGQVDQPRFLAERLGMEPAFGKFMDYQGGQYGLAILSRLPIDQARVIPLPEGNEPRVALLVRLRLPDGQPLAVANLHFDWVDDDTFRFAQATRLAGELESVEVPLIVAGDFNDEPDSRTVRLLGGPPRQSTGETGLTWPAGDPRRQIDFVFARPADRWRIPLNRPRDAGETSDHRPVVTMLELLGPAHSGR